LSSIRVLRMIARLNVGGPARHVVWLSAALPSQDFTTLLVTGKVPPGEDDMGWFAREHGVEPVVIPELSREISPRDISVIWKAVRLLLEYRPHIVHTHTAKAGAVGRVAALIYNLLPLRRATHPRIRVVHTYHGHVFHSYYGRLKTLLFLTIERILARCATDRILVLSEQQRREISADFKVGAPDKFRIVPLGIDFDRVRASRDKGRALRRQFDIPQKAPTVGIVGRLTEVKNHALFLQAAERVARSRDDVRFLIFGEGLQKKGIERRIAELSLGDRVFLAGTEEPETIYGAVDIVGLTSLNEGTPLALIEAMANGIPVISTAVGGVVDVLGAESETSAAGYTIRERGVTVSSEDTEAFAAGLQRLLLDRDLGAALAREAQEHALSHYSRDRLIADIVTTYNELR
jgi:glycosyltransferase involved in cell wall biosynthesis